MIIRNHFLVNRRRRRCYPDDGQSGSGGRRGEERRGRGRRKKGRKRTPTPTPREEPNGEWAGERPIGLRRLGIRLTGRSERRTTESKDLYTELC